MSARGDEAPAPVSARREDEAPAPVSAQQNDVTTPRALRDGSSPMDPDVLLALLSDMGIEAETVRHRPVFTVEEAREHRGDLPGVHVKNLFVRDPKGAMWLVVALENRTIDLRALAETLGHRRFSFGSPRRLMEYLGVVPGAVTPFAVVNDRGGEVRVALDTGLRDADAWNFHPLDNAMTTTIAPADMLRFLDAVDHAPIWVEIGATS